jgi:hypothetical protein
LKADYECLEEKMARYLDIDQLAINTIRTRPSTPFRRLTITSPISNRPGSGGKHGQKAG